MRRVLRATRRRALEIVVLVTALDCVTPMRPGDHAMAQQYTHTDFYISYHTRETETAI